MFFSLLMFAIMREKVKKKANESGVGDGYPSLIKKTD